jgi:hypothetical protein
MRNASKAARNFIANDAARMTSIGTTDWACVNLWGRWYESAESTSATSRVEGLNVQAMVKLPALAKSVSDAGRRMFAIFLRYRPSVRARSIVSRACSAL